MRSLLGHVAGQMRDLVQQTTSWRGCRVWVVDGSNVSMPDTPDLQRAFPQHCQKAGCGFPIAQFVALFCWTTGAILDVAIDTLRPHEITLFRNRWHHFQAGDVVLADRAYCNYVDMARLQQLGVNSVFRLHQRRCCDFRRVKRLGYDDGRVLWPRPHSWWPSMGIDQETFETLPPTLAIRLIRMTNAPRGFRSRTVVVATTLLDPIQYPADEIRRLYRDRWTAELNFRSLKTQLGMDMLHGKSRDVVLKEIIMHLLAYNLIRLLMWEAARQHGRDLHRLSLAGTLHRIRFIFPRLLLQPSRANLSGAKLFQQLLAWIAADPIPHRPDRIEPRRVKRRPKTYSRLTKPRDFYRRRTVGAERDAR